MSLGTKTNATEQLRDTPKEEEMLSYMDVVEEEEEPEPSYTPVHPTPGTDVVDISDDED